MFKRIELEKDMKRIMKSASLRIAMLVALLPLWLGGFSAQATNVSDGDKVAAVKIVEHTPVVVKDYHIEVALDAILDQLRLGTYELLIVTPELRANGDRKDLVATLPSFIITGSTRDRALAREVALGNTPGYMEPAPLFVTKRTNGKPQQVSYQAREVYQAWMLNAALYVRLDLTGCAECGKASEERLINPRVISEPYKPSYQLSYLVPEAEPVKNRADSYKASIAFRVNKDDIDPSYQNNRAVLEDVDSKVATIMKNKDLQVSDVRIVGYASPEGRASYNQDLAERRSRSFANYLVSKHGVNAQRLQVTGYGEDWGLVKQMLQENQGTLTESERSQVLDIIDRVSDLDARDPQIKRINKGATWVRLLESIFPSVRRTEYTFSYVVRAFDIEEAKVVLRSNPKLLSLNEMYLVANSYAPDSKEFKEVFDIAVRLFPDQPVAIINASAVDIEGGNYDAAIARLKKLESDARTWNNLGVAYAKKGDAATAKAYFEKSAQAGVAEATHNLEEMEKEAANSVDPTK